MPQRIVEIPTDKPIAGIHSVPFLDDGSIVMGWHPGRGLLETIGGRLETGETMEQALHREANEEGGITLAEPFLPFAAHYWESTDTYTLFVVDRVSALFEIPSEFETTGRVITNVQTAQEIIRKVEHNGEWRVQLLEWASEAIKPLLEE